MSMTPSTPAPSATRSRAPRFCGSSTPSRARRRRAAAGVGGRGREEIFDGEEFLRADEGDDALVGGGFGGEGQLLARLLTDADASLAALGDQPARGGRRGARGPRGRGQSGACRP